MRHDPRPRPAGLAGRGVRRLRRGRRVLHGHHGAMPAGARRRPAVAAAQPRRGLRALAGGRAGAGCGGRGAPGHGRLRRDGGGRGGAGAGARPRRGRDRPPPAGPRASGLHCRPSRPRRAGRCRAVRRGRGADALPRPARARGTGPGGGGGGSRPRGPRDRVRHGAAGRREPAHRPRGPGGARAHSQARDAGADARRVAGAGRRGRACRGLPARPADQRRRAPRQGRRRAGAAAHRGR